MGNALARYRSRKNRRVLLVGLDAAGKTTLLFRLYAGKTLNTIPTVGFNMKTVRIQGLNMNIWDVGGQDQLREFWRHHFTGTQGVVFVVDAADQDRLTDAKAEFEKVVTDESSSLTLQCSSWPTSRTHPTPRRPQNWSASSTSRKCAGIENGMSNLPRLPQAMVWRKHLRGWQITWSHFSCEEQANTNFMYLSIL